MPSTEPRAQGRDEPLIPADPTARKHVMVALLLAAVATLIAYFEMYRPVHEALASGGALRYYTRGVILPPELLYLAVLVLTVKVGDGEIYAMNAKNKRTLTRKGWFVVFGAVAVAAAAMGCWTLYLGALGYRGA